MLNQRDVAQHLLYTRDIVYKAWSQEGMITLEISYYVLEIPNYAFTNTQSRVLHADWLMTRCWKIMRRQLCTLTFPILFSDLSYCCRCSSAPLMLHIQQTQIHCTQVYRAVLMKWAVINNVWPMYRKLWRICQTTFKRLVRMETVMLSLMSWRHGDKLSLKIWDVNNIATQCNLSLEVPEILSQNHIYFHWLSVSGNSNILHCGILIYIPYSLNWQHVNESIFPFFFRFF